MNNIRYAAVLALLAATVLAARAVVAQGSIDAKQEALLKRLFPAATAFSPKGGDPPHFKAFSGDARSGQTLLGLAFWTTELEPLRAGVRRPDQDSGRHGSRKAC